MKEGICNFAGESIVGEERHLDVVLRGGVDRHRVGLVGRVVDELDAGGAFEARPRLGDVHLERAQIYGPGRVLFFSGDTTGVNPWGTI